jgi:hypothetical protein
VIGATHRRGGRRSTAAEPCSTQTAGRRTRATSSIGRATRTASASERSSVRAFGDELAEHHREVRDDQKRDHDARPGGQPVAQQVSYEGLAERAGQDADRRDADLHRRDHAHRIVHEAKRSPGAAMSGVSKRRQRAPARRHNRVLADHEERVRGDETQDHRTRRASSMTGTVARRSQRSARDKPQVGARQRVASGAK